MSNLPVKKWRKGGVSVAMFENEFNNKKMSSFQIQKSYKTQGGEWKNTTSLNASDLPQLMSVIMQIMTEGVKVMESGQEQNSRRPQQQPQQPQQKQQTQQEDYTEDDIPF